MTKKDALAKLTTAGVFYGADDEDPEMAQTLNMNDTWCWGSAWGEYVPDDQLVEVWWLFFMYGWCGLLYWVSKKDNGRRSEFYHYNRMIEFVENEERLRQQFPKSSALAYHQASYEIKGERNNT